MKICSLVSGAIQVVAAILRPGLNYSIDSTQAINLATTVFARGAAP